MWKQDTKSLPL